MSDRFHELINELAITAMPHSEADNLVYSIQCQPGGGAVRVIRGWKCLTYESLHNEVSAALQFPNYYGENWDAMDECITDLEWMPADWYLIYVSGIEDVLPDDEEGFSIFLSVLSDASERWANPEKRGLAYTEEVVRKPFIVIISGTEEGLLRASSTTRGNKASLDFSEVKPS